MTMRVQRSIAVVAAALVAGCAVTVEDRRPRPELPGTYRGAEAETAGARAFGDLGWWEVYRDQRLAALIERGLDRNRDLRIAAARILETRANLGVAEYGPLPVVNATAAYTRSRVSTVTPTTPPGANPDRRQLRAAIDASYEIDFWGRIAALSRAAQADLGAAEAARQVVQATLVGDVATAYFDLLSLDQQLAITERTIASRQRFLELTQTRLRLGAATRLDVDRAQANLTAAQAAVPDLKRRIGQAENLLQVLTGGYPAPVERTAVADALPSLPEVPAGLPSTLLERRPDVRQAADALAGTSARVAAQRAALFPSFSLNATVGSDARQLGDFMTSPSRIWSFGPSILQPILNASRNRFLVDAAAAREVQAIEQYQKVVEQSVREVADALIARREFGEARIVTAEQVRVLREVERVATRRYEAGVSSYFEVIDAQRDLLVAELALAQVSRNALVSSVQLYKALGGGWQLDGRPQPVRTSSLP